MSATRAPSYLLLEWAVIALAVIMLVILDDHSEGFLPHISISREKAAKTSDSANRVACPSLPTPKACPTVDCPTVVCPTVESYPLVATAHGDETRLIQGGTPQEACPKVVECPVVTCPTVVCPMLEAEPCAPSHHVNHTVTCPLCPACPAVDTSSWRSFAGDAVLIAKTSICICAITAWMLLRSRRPSHATSNNEQCIAHQEARGRQEMEALADTHRAIVEWGLSVLQSMPRHCSTSTIDAAPSDSESFVLRGSQLVVSPLTPVQSHNTSLHHHKDNDVTTVAIQTDVDVSTQCTMRALRSMHDALAAEMDRHWFARADGLYNEARLSVKHAANVRRLEDCRRREETEAQKRLESSTQSLSLQLQQAQQEAARTRALDEQRYGDLSDAAHQRVVAWEARYEAIEKERSNLFAEVIRYRELVAISELQQSTSVREMQRLQTTLDAAIEERNQAEALVKSKLVMNLAVQCAPTTSSIGVDACVADSIRVSQACQCDDVNACTIAPSDRDDDPTTETPPHVDEHATQQLVAEALLLENREKHLARLNACLVELEHQYKQGSDNGTPTPLHGLSRRGSPYLDNGTYSRLTPTSDRDLTSLYESLAMHHCGVSRRALTPQSSPHVHSVRSVSGPGKR